MRVVFTRTYNHRWPSRAITEFQVTGGVSTVKKEVGEAAIAAGKARLPTKKDNEAAASEEKATSPAPRAKAVADGAKRKAPAKLAVRNTAADRDHAPADKLEPADGGRIGAEPSDVPGA